MNAMPFSMFECHMYVSNRHGLQLSLPTESGPKHVVQLEPLSHDKLVDPSFRRLLAAFESLPRSLKTVQV
jgi:hypothetical protein